MKKILFALCCTTFLFSCNNEKNEATETESEPKAAAPPADLPYTPSYATTWSADVSDADLKTVLMSYKEWENGNMPGLAATMADTATVDMNDGTHLKLSNADLMKRWSSYRDSLSSVRIKMDTWQKMHSSLDSNNYVIVWYDEYDTFKDGRVDSASYHDINHIKNGKIVWYSQYKRPKK